MAEEVLDDPAVFLEVRLRHAFTQRCGHMSRTLSKCSMLNSHELIIEMCEQGSLKGFQVAFGCRGIPPFVSDEEV